MERLAGGHKLASFLSRKSVSSSLNPTASAFCLCNYVCILFSFCCFVLIIEWIFPRASYEAQRQRKAGREKKGKTDDDGKADQLTSSSSSLSICLPIYLANLSLSMFLSFYLSAYLSIYLANLSLCLSVSSPVASPSARVFVFCTYSNFFLPGFFSRLTVSRTHGI